MKRLLICFFLLAAGQLVHAQYYKTDTTIHKGFDPSRLVLGGSLGMVFGDYTNVDVSPLVGYRFSDYIAAGINVNAQYGQYRTRDIYSNTTYSRDKYTIFGGGIWGRVYPLPMVFVHIQPEYNFISQSTTVYANDGSNMKQTYKTNYSVPSLLVGAGYTQSVGGRVGIGISILYDVIQDARSPYRSNLIYRVGAGLGF
ncbi:hypothetical protein HGH93_01305 [Chitinophaga polysaccharea]|uniref:hypothetical protein n=1 Tax=Chitinophaga TaxID=79328 RepID=UPI001455B9C9|nr:MULTISPECIES: hypothetical protein [Chitinophaga]NLR56718.1 hypothetical protein [Chitinophaga polysaccharea]NLU92946.1 hypothetical protein [Chitinophaga sp. Ak27]